MSDEELTESELGTQEYWDNRYQLEISNFKEHGATGEAWFGEECMERICRWILKSNQIKKDSKLIDIGCGNGVLLVQLARNGLTNLTGIDYSEGAITLAKQIAEKEHVRITYKTSDLLRDELTEKYNVVHDKGTYDAISLSSDAKNKRKIYLSQVSDLLEENGIFIITSCNWTEAELVTHFSRTFTVLCIIPTPQFTFGGQVGKSFCSLVFQKSN